MRPFVGEGVGEHVAGSGRRLEAAGAPAAVEIEPLDGRLADDGTGIRTDVDDAAPLAVHAHPAESGEQFADRGKSVLDDVKRTALAVAVVAVGPGADDEVALVGLADVAVDGVGHHHGVETGLERFGDQGLQGTRLDGQAQPRHSRQDS